MKVIYIHGFNSGKGQKVIDLENHGYNVICPQLSTDVHKDVTTLINLINKFENEVIHIVGCSLGGFYGLILLALLKPKNRIHYHLINPSIEPWETISKYLDKQMVNYKTGEVYELSISFLNELREYEHLINSIPADDFVDVTFYFGTKDTILDYTNLKEWIELFEIPTKIIETNQGHRYKDISTVIEEIDDIELIHKLGPLFLGNGKC